VGGGDHVRVRTRNRMGGRLVSISGAGPAEGRHRSARRVPPPVRAGRDMAIARISHLSYWYPGADEPALRDVSSLIDAGLTLVSGPSGGGKSTFLRVLNGLVPHFHGGRISGGAEVAGLDIITTPTRHLAR